MKYFKKNLQYIITALLVIGVAYSCSDDGGDSPAPTPTPTPTPVAVAAQFTADKTTITAGESVQFTDTSTGSPTAWEWTFAGGTPATSTAQNPSVTYAIAGTYAVTLKASKDGSEDTETKTAFITVNAAVVARDFTELENEILSNMASSGRTGLGVFIITNNQVIYQKGFGKANKETNTDITAQTPFLLASVSKGITGLILMKLFDEGKFQLDEDINTYLPFSVRNPNHPDTPITFRMLMAHASSISDATYNELGDVVYKFDGTDFDPSNVETQLGTLMRDLLDASGKHFNAGGQSSYFSYKPGEGTTYSNIGSALCGYLAERIAGEDFASYSKKALFEPLEMSNTSWRLNDFDNSKLTMPYNESGTAIGHYTFVDYPNGGLRSSLEDMSKIMLMLMQNGTVNGVQILKSSTVELLKQKTTQFTNTSGTTYGLKWFYDQDGNNAEIFGHNGGEQGVSSQFFYNPATGIGFMAVSNKTDDNLGPIQDALFNEGEK